MEAYLRGGGVLRHRSLLTAFQRSCFALLLAPGLAVVAAVADDARDSGGTTSGRRR